LLGFLQILTNIRHFPVNAGIGTLVSGIMTGVIVGVLMPLRLLRVIERKGEFRTPISTLLIGIGAAFVAISVLLIASNLSVDVLRLALVFLSPLPSIILAFRAFIFSRRERKHGKWILTATWSNKIYVYPKIEQPL
jgi:LytS/YehU family sensor histidine kinase